MISSALQKFIKILSLSRGFSCCSALTTSKQISQVRKPPKLIPLFPTTMKSKKATSTKEGIKKKKPKKRKIVIKRVSDDIEAVWLENLTGTNLELFRKTSFGSYRKINLDNLLLRIKEIFPSTFEIKNSAVDTAKSGTENSENVCKTESRIESTKFTASAKTRVPKVTPVQKVKKPSEPSEDVTASPWLSEYLIQHIVQFPLLKEKNSVTEFAEMEVEDFGEMDAQAFPSVSTILNDTMSIEARMRLKMWKKKMIEKMGEEEFAKYAKGLPGVLPLGMCRLVQWLRLLGLLKSADLLVRGTKFHATVKTYLEVADKSLVKVPPELEGCWKSLENIFPDISDVIFTEEYIYHPILKYKGIVDCVAHYRGVPCVFEWKKSNKVKAELSATFDAPLQLCAYLGALNWHKKMDIENGAVVVVYTDGTPANVFQMPLESCEVYWVEWLRRVQSYWLKKNPTIVQNEM